MNQQGSHKQKTSIGKLIILGVLVLGGVTFFYFDLGQYFTLSALKKNKDMLQNYTQANYGAL